MTIKLELCIMLYLNQKKEIKNLKLFMKKKIYNLSKNCNLVAKICKKKKSRSHVYCIIILCYFLLLV